MLNSYSEKNYCMLASLGGKKPQPNKPAALPWASICGIAIGLLQYCSKSQNITLFYNKNVLVLCLKWQRWLFLMKYILKYMGFSRKNSLKSPHKFPLTCPSLPSNTVELFFTSHNPGCPRHSISVRPLVLWGIKHFVGIKSSMLHLQQTFSPSFFKGKMPCY